MAGFGHFLEVSFPFIAFGYDEDIISFLKVRHSARIINPFLETAVLISIISNSFFTTKIMFFRRENHRTGIQTQTSSKFCSPKPFTCLVSKHDRLGFAGVLSIPHLALFP